MLGSIIIGIISGLFRIYSFMIIIYILMSWVPQLKATPLGEILERLVEPYLAPFRRWVPAIGMIDISPIVAIFVLHFAERGLIRLLFYVF